MLRFVLASSFLFAGGCLSVFRGGIPPGDQEGERVQDAIHKVAARSFERSVKGDGWQPHLAVTGSSGCSGYINGQIDRHMAWQCEFACAKLDSPPGEPVWRLPASEYTRILTPIRQDVAAAVEKTDVEVSWVSPIEFRDGAEPIARFEIRYLRRHRTVAGEVIGTIEPASAKSGPDTTYTDVKVTLREWTCK